MLSGSWCMNQPASCGISSSDSLPKSSQVHQSWPQNNSYDRWTISSFRIMSWPRQVWVCLKNGLQYFKSSHSMAIFWCKPWWEIIKIWSCSQHFQTHPFWASPPQFPLENSSTSGRLRHQKFAKPPPNRCRLAAFIGYGNHRIWELGAPIISNN